MVEAVVAYSPWGLRLATGAALAGAVLGGVTACEGSPQPEVFAEETAANPTEQDTQRDLRGPCKLSPVSDEKMKNKTAEHCLAAMKSGEVALVAFDVPTETAKRIAGDVEKTLKTASNGLIRLSVEVVEASDEAKKDAANIRGIGDCLSTDKGYMVSQAADRAMPELHTKDMIVALTADKSCTPNELGKIDPLTQRHADVYDVTPKNRKINGVAAAHETGHLFGGGHSGEILGAGDDDVFGPYIEGNGKDVNLSKHLESNEYRAYGYPRSIMGAPTSTEDITPHPIDIAAWSWPQTELKGEQASPAKNINSGWTNLNTKAAAAGHFGSVELETPLELTADDNGEQHTFDRLAVLPTLEAGDTGPIGGVDLMLVDSDYNSAAIGSIIRDSDRNTTTITYGSQRIEIRWSDNAIGIRTR